MTIATDSSGWALDAGGPEAYERYIVPAWMAGWAETLVRAAGVGPGARVLDVACGTGIVARKAAPMAGPNGRVTGTDSDGGMLDTAARHADLERIENADWRLCDVCRMPFDHGVFDVTLCQQGLQFFPDKEAALREMVRVTAPGGKIAISVWRSMDRSPFLNILAEIIGDYLGAGATAVFHASCSLHDREQLRMLLGSAGLRDIHVRLEAMVSRHPSFAEFLPGYLSVFPFAADLAALEDEKRGEMFRGICRAMAAYLDDDGFAAPMEAHIITAIR